MAIYSVPERASGLWSTSARAQVLNFFARVDADGEAQRWRKYWQYAHGFLVGEHRAALQARLAILFPEIAPDWNQDEAGHRYFPLIRMYCDRLAVCTHRYPDTWLMRDGERLPEGDPMVQQWRRDEETLRLEEVLPQAERLMIASNQCIINPAWVNGAPRWNVLAPYQLRVDQDPAEPDRIAGAPHISMMLPQRKDSASPAEVDANALWLTWQRDVTRDRFGAISAEEWRCWLHDRGGELRNNPLFRDNVNRYRLAPFALWRAAAPLPGRLWLPPNVGWHHQQLSADFKLMDLDQNMRLQLHAQPVASGAAEMKNVPLGPDKLITDPGTDFKLEFVSPDPNVELGISHFNFDLRATAVAESLPPDTWEAGSSTRNLAAKKLEQDALQMRRRSMVAAAKRAFVRAFQIHQRIVSVHRPEATLDGVQLGVDFPPLPEVTDRFQDSQASAVELQHNLTNPVDVLMRRHGITRRDAVVRLERNRLVNEQYAGAAAAPAAASAGGTQRPSDVQR
jgi:hypothetical protein